MSDSTSTFKNEKIDVNLTHKPGSAVLLEITVNPTGVEEAYSKALKSINKEVSLPGFRKGKAPEKVIETNYERQIQKEWRITLLDTYFREALDLAKIQPFKSDGIKASPISELARNKEARFTVEFEVPPNVPAITLNEMSIKNVERLPVTQRDIEQVIDNVRHYYAEWKEVAGRGVEDGDFIDLDIDKLDEPVESICRDMRFSVKEGQMANWMRSLVLGLKRNESAEGTSEREELQPGQEEVEFIPTRCRLTVKSIKQAILPEVNEEFARKVGTENIEQLQERIAIDLNRRADDQVRQGLRNQVDKWLLEHQRFEVPASMLQVEVESRLKDIEESLIKQNTSQDIIRRRLVELKEPVTRDAENGYRLFFILATIAQQKGIEVTQEELAQELSQQIMSGANSSFVGMNSNDIRSRLTQQLLLRKSRDFIIDHIRRENS